MTLRAHRWGPSRWHNPSSSCTWTMGVVWIRDVDGCIPSCFGSYERLRALSNVPWSLMASFISAFGHVLIPCSSPHGWRPLAIYTGDHPSIQVPDTAPNILIVNPQEILNHHEALPLLRCRCLPWPGQRCPQGPQGPPVWRPGL